ncbi:hypothetical protein TNCV_1717451 [Trichonephila clavipes]|nr:hypothetical protein TNCV_1717451 [Trichonephila clavipes]
MEKRKLSNISKIRNRVDPALAVLSAKKTPHGRSNTGAPTDVSAPRRWVHHPTSSVSTPQRGFATPSDIFVVPTVVCSLEEGVAEFWAGGAGQSPDEG